MRCRSAGGAVPAGLRRHVQAGRTLGARHLVHAVSARENGDGVLTFSIAPASIVYDLLRILNVPPLLWEEGADGAADRGDRRRRRRHRRGRGRQGGRPAADVRVYTEFEDVGYSPCGIPYVHGKEIPDFERLFLATKDAYTSTASTSTTRRGSPDSTPSQGRVRGRRGRGRLRQADRGHRLRLCRSRGARHRSRQPVLREEHPQGHGMGQGAGRRQDGRRGRGVPAGPGDGHRAVPPRHQDAPDRPGRVGAVGGHRPGHRRPGPGFLAGKGRRAPLRHHADRLPRRRLGPGRGHLRRGDPV